jgi:transcriptional regulator with AAA-type ATPase domain
VAFFQREEKALAQAFSKLAYCNPFLPERIECEREVLGEEFVPLSSVWSIRADSERDNPNVLKLKERVEGLAGRLRKRLSERPELTANEQAFYEDVILYLLYSRYEDDFYRAIVKEKSTAGSARFYSKFVRDAEHFLAVPGVDRPSSSELAHFFACFFQIRRAFHHIFSYIVGASLPAARLRAGIWQSIFTHDVRRYRRSLYQRMGDVTTLVSGPSGTGKELVARAIGLSRYIPFDPKSESFAAETEGSFHALNLSALSPTLIESELFGHRKGAFTGALQDRSGWLEVCPPLGTVFLDEIGELDGSIQVKLLRVLQTREFQRLGETSVRRFRGKIIAATNRNLAQEMQAGRFREDLYYRLCSDLIVTPSLREQLLESPDELRNLVLFIAQRVAGPEEAETLATEVEEWIDEHLGRDYPWAGNVRELEQCVRNILIRKEYRAPMPESPNAGKELADALCAGEVTAEELLRRYCTLVYSQTGSYQETARRLMLDRRTIKSKIDPELLDMLRGGEAQE